MVREVYLVYPQSASHSRIATGMTRRSPCLIHRGYETGDAAHQAPRRAIGRTARLCTVRKKKKPMGTQRTAKNSSCRFSRA